MSYLVLARKLRPPRFQDLIGQEHIWKTLITAIRTDRVAHAFLFTGPRGTGKTSCARILTKALNCTSPVDFEPCNQCENCLEINQGIATDVMEIDAASNRGIEHIRELRESVKFSPAKCLYKTYIIDEVHMLTAESFNALLKTLEEPPAHVKFILATTDQHKIPTTVISRCQRYDFTNIPTRTMVDYLRKVADAESLRLSDSALHLIASHSAGGMRDALTTMDMLIGFGSEQIRDDNLVEILGLNDVKEIDNLLERIVKKDLAQSLSLFNNLINKGRSLAQLVTDLLKSIKDLTLVKSLPAEKIRWHKFLPDQLDKYTDLAKKTTLATLQQYFHILLEVESQIKYSSQARTCVEMGLIKMCSVESLVGVAEVISLLRRTSIEPSKKLNDRHDQIQASTDRILTPVTRVYQPANRFQEPKAETLIDTNTTSQTSGFPDAVSPTNTENNAPPVADPAIDQGRKYEEIVSENDEPPSVAEDSHKPEKTEPDISSKVIQESGPTASSLIGAPTDSIIPHNKEDISQKWQAFVDEVEKQSNKALLSLLRNSVVLEMDHDKLVIGYNHAQAFSDDKKRTIAQAARDFFSTPIKVFYREQNQGIGDSLNVRTDKELEQKEEALKVKAANHPKVLELLKIFPESKIKKISIKES